MIVQLDVILSHILIGNLGFFIEKVTLKMSFFFLNQDILDVLWQETPRFLVSVTKASSVCFTGISTKNSRRCHKVTVYNCFLLSLRVFYSRPYLFEI